MNEREPLNLRDAIRRCPLSSTGYNAGDTDELMQMFTAALTWDGNHSSKESRDHLIENGFAYRVEGMTALTGRGKLAALFCWPMPKIWWRRYRRVGIRRAFHREDQKSATT